MYTNFLILITEIALSIGISTLIIYLLQPVLQALLQEVCHGKTRALFWSTFTRLMLLIAPLLVVLLFSNSLSGDGIFYANVLRDTLLHILFGQFSGLLIVGGVLLRFSSIDHSCGDPELPYIPLEKE